jgi:mannosyl-3-phosphoglycerate phosphatase family protein
MADRLTLDGTVPVAKVQWLVVTDLDGTMLNHDSYDMEAARAAIKLLQYKNIPLILNTSKTFAETITIRQMLDIHDAFIVENGSSLFLPKNRFDRPADATERDDYWSIILGASHQQIENILLSIGLPDAAAIRLSRCSIEQTIALTGLNATQAEQAVAREFSEPLIWQADKNALSDFRQQLRQHGLATLQGGRFLHVIGNCDKGMATKRLASCYRDDVRIIALGDSANDAAMLSAADISIIVKSPSNHQLQERITADIHTQQPAPDGWREAIEKSLKQIHLIEE